MVAQRVLVLLAKVRFLLGRQVKKQLHGVIGSMPDFGSGGGGSNPSGVYMEFVAQLVECQVVLWWSWVRSPSNSQMLQ